MSKASWVYISMLLAMGGGLWAILSFGAFLQAPELLVGTWDLVPAESPRSDTAFTGPLVIEQSGIYANLYFKSGEHLQMELHDEPTFTIDHAAKTTRLSNPQWELVITGLRGAPERQMILSGEQRHEWTARRRGVDNASQPATPELQPVGMAPPDQTVIGPSPATQPLKDDARP